MELKEIIDMILKVDEEGNSDTSISMAIYDVSKEEAEELTFEGTLGPKISMTGTLDNIIVDITFDGEYNVDLYKFWNILCRYKELLGRSTLEETDIVPYLNIIFLPMEEEGKVYAEACNPLIWCLTALNVGKPITTIRMVFPAEHIGFYTADDIDMSDVKAEIIMDERRRESVESMDAQRKRQREERMKELEEMRKNNL